MLSETPTNESEKTEKKTLKPGKGYSIIALLCSFVPVLAIFLNAVLGPHWHKIAGELGPISLFGFLLALIFGIMGRKTEGWLYANIALAIVLAFGLLALVVFIGLFVHIVILQLPT